MNLRILLGVTFAAALTACGGPAPTPPEAAPPPVAVTVPAKAQAPRVPSPAVRPTSQEVPVAVLNPDVTQETIQQTVCVSGYTATVRPAVSYTNGVKKKLLREQNLDVATIRDYELDHRVPLAIGGHPRNIGNLMLQPWVGADGAKRKDALERRLQLLVCAGKVPLAQAQQAIYVNWQAAAIAYPSKSQSRY